MKIQNIVRRTAKWSAAGAAVATAGYAGYAAFTWARYGHPSTAKPEETDVLLDRFIPTYEISERHHISVPAPAEATFEAACEMDMMESPLARAIFKTREIALGSEPDTTARPRGLLAFAKSIGWGVLAETPGREIVMGTVTQPWKANVVFRTLSPEEFVAFNEPNYVKIVWTLRADETTPGNSIFRHETRVQTTDGAAREKFRRYWALVSPGIKVIRWVMLEPLRRDAIRKAAA